MKERTLRLHFKMVRLARGALNAWESWLIDEATDAGLVEVIKDFDPIAYHKAINNHSAPTGRVPS